MPIPVSGIFYHFLINLGNVFWFLWVSIPVQNKHWAAPHLLFLMWLQLILRGFTNNMELLPGASSLVLDALDVRYVSSVSEVEADIVVGRSWVKKWSKWKQAIRRWGDQGCFAQPRGPPLSGMARVCPPAAFHATLDFCSDHVVLDPWNLAPYLSVLILWRTGAKKNRPHGDAQLRTPRRNPGTSHKDDTAHRHRQMH